MASIIIRIVFVCFLVAGCATSPGRFSDTAISLNEDAFSSLIGPLRPQQLLDGQCGLFLWSRDEGRNLVFFGLSARSEGKMMIAGQEVTLKRISARGEAFFGQHPNQTYKKGDISVTLSLGMEARPNMAGGAVVSRGSLRFEQTGGWNLVVPVGGLVACQPA